MKSIFQACEEQLEQYQYAAAIKELPHLVRVASSPAEMILAARVAGLALFPGLERRLLRQAVRDRTCPPEGFLRLGSYYVSQGAFLLVDELLVTHLLDPAWPVLDRAKAHGLLAVAMAARHRYQTAEVQLQRARHLVGEAGVEEPIDLLYDRLAVPYFAGRWEEVEQGLLNLINQGRGNPNIYQLLVRCREHLGRPFEALEAVKAACERFPDHPQLWLLQGGLCWSLNRPDEALMALRRHGALLPYPRHDRNVSRLRALIARQAHRLAVPVVRQGRNHCFPASLAMVRGYWGKTDDQRVIGSAVMDGVHGTPLYRAVQFLEQEGWNCRTFRASIERVKLLIDCGVPPVLGLEYSGGAHVHVCVGYDDEHQELVLQDPAHPYPARLRYRDFDEVYAQSDYWAMAFVPASWAEVLETLPVDDDRMIRLAQRLWEALRESDLPTAGEALIRLAEMGETPGIHMTRLRAWPHLGSREGALLSADRLLSLFPDHVQIRTEVAQHLTRLNEPNRAFAVVRDMVGSRPAQAWLIMADEASRSGRASEEVISHCRRAVLMDQLSPHPLAEWGREEQRARNYARAEELFQAAYEMDPQPTFAADLAALKADQGNLKEALTGLRAVIRMAPRYPWAWWRRGEIHWAMGQIRSAVRSLQVAVQQAPEDPHYLLRLSQAYQQAGREQQAATLLRASPHLGDSAELQNTFAVLLLNQGAYQEAHDLARAAMLRFADDPRFPAIAAEALRRTGRAMEGRALLESARNRMPDNAYLAGRMGQFLLREGQAQAGVDALLEARKLAVDWRIPVQWAIEIAEERASRPLLEFLQTEAERDMSWHVARLWLSIDREQALKVATEALRREGRTAEALTEFGRVAVDAERPSEAEQAFQEALRIQAEIPRACYGMALLAERQSNRQSYANWMRRAVAASADQEAARRYADRFGDYLEQRGDWAELSRFVMEIEGRVPEGWRITYMGYVNEQQGHFEVAHGLYDRAQEIDSGLPWPHFRRVMTLLEQGRNEEAAASAMAASLRFPNDVSIAWGRGRAHLAIGQAEEASEAYRQALRLDPDRPFVRSALFDLWSGQGWTVLAEKARDLPTQPQADLLAEWGEAYLEAGAPQEAHGILRLAADLDPQSDRALLGLAKVELHHERYDHAWDWAVKVLLRNPGQVTGWLPTLCANSPSALNVRFLTRIIREMPAVDRRVRAEVREQLAQSYATVGSIKEALLVSEETLLDDPGHLEALSRLAAVHAKQGRWSLVYERLYPLCERRAIPVEMPALIDLFTKAAFFLNRPRRPHWRDLVLARLLHLRRIGVFAGTEAVSLRRTLTRLELEFRNLRSAYYALQIRDASWNMMAVSLQAVVTRLKRVPLDVRDGEATGPVLKCSLARVRYEAPGRSQVYKRFVRTLGHSAGWAYASPGTFTMILLFSAVFSFEAGLWIGGVPLLAMLGLPYLPGVTRVEEEP